MISLYIHIPFCRSKCKYCSFYSVVGERSSYISALENCILQYGKKNKQTVKSVYFGGGTPSVLTVSELSRLMQTIKDSFTLWENCEITLECNPDSVNFEYFCAAKKIGINRVSLGVQSLNDKQLLAVGRRHDKAAAKAAIKNAQKAGFENISCDIIFGLPYQSVFSLVKSLKALTSLGVCHISCYNLQVEKGTPLYSENLPLPNEKTQRKMYFKVCSFLQKKGYIHYEISNFSKPGKQSLHNSSYWDGSDYIGLGAAAHSKLNDIRASFDADIEKFCKKNDFDFDTKEQIKNPLFEQIMLTLRTKNGLALSLIPKSESYVKKLCDNGFATLQNGRLVLTDKGFYLSNTIISDITAKEC